MNRKYPVDKQLENDCHSLCQLDHAQLLLMNNAAVLWFILVPDSDKTEWFELSEKQQFQLNHTINQLSRFVKQKMHFDKVNIAAIGNIVKQLHIHVIGRKESDDYWPGVVWGEDKIHSYTPEEVDNIRQKISQHLATITD